MRRACRRLGAVQIVGIRGQMYYLQIVHMLAHQCFLFGRGDRPVGSVVAEKDQSPDAHLDHIPGLCRLVLAVDLLHRLQVEGRADGVERTACGGCRPEKCRCRVTGTRLRVTLFAGEPILPGFDGGDVREFAFRIFGTLVGCPQ